MPSSSLPGPAASDLGAGDILQLLSLLCCGCRVPAAEIYKGRTSELVAEFCGLHPDEARQLTRALGLSGGDRAGDIEAWLHKASGAERDRVLEWMLVGPFDEEVVAGQLRRIRQDKKFVPFEARDCEVSADPARDPVPSRKLYGALAKHRGYSRCLAILVALYESAGRAHQYGIVKKSLVEATREKLEREGRARRASAMSGKAWLELQVAVAWSYLSSRLSLPPTPWPTSRDEEDDTFPDPEAPPGPDDPYGPDGDPPPPHPSPSTDPFPETLQRLKDRYRKVIREKDKRRAFKDRARCYLERELVISFEGLFESVHQFYLTRGDSRARWLNQVCEEFDRLARRDSRFGGDFRKRRHDRTAFDGRLLNGRADGLSKGVRDPELLRRLADLLADCRSLPPGAAEDRFQLAAQIFKARDGEDGDLADKLAGGLAEEDIEDSDDESSHDETTDGGRIGLVEMVDRHLRGSGTDGGLTANEAVHDFVDLCLRVHELESAIPYLADSNAKRAAWAVADVFWGVTIGYRYRYDVEIGRKRETMARRVFGLPALILRYRFVPLRLDDLLSLQEEP